MSEKYTFLDLAFDVLREAEVPMSSKQIWDEAEKRGLHKKLQSESKIPEKTLGVSLELDSKRENTRFSIVSQRPKKFWLKSRSQELDSEEMSVKLQEQEEQASMQEQKDRKRYESHERDLHPLLVKFVRESEEFNLYCKTIYHELSKKQKSGQNRWIHPDIVGVHFPFGFQKQTADLLKNFSKTPYKLFSFELKVKLNFGNLREYYFQAVSNSSWANEGYLVVLECDESKEFIKELWRLNNAFGIGVIQLNPEDLISSKILIPAKERENLDFETLDLLVEMNADFEKFIESINRNIKVSDSAYIIEKDYDEVKDDEEMQKYIIDKKLNQL